MKIKTSLDWNTVKNGLLSDMQRISYNNDLHKMLRAIDHMNMELSKIEVEARRSKNDSRCGAKLKEINEAVENLEKWIVMAILME
jgi:hypothetical protein